MKAKQILDQAENYENLDSNEFSVPVFNYYVNVNESKMDDENQPFNDYSDDGKDSNNPTDEDIVVETYKEIQKEEEDSFEHINMEFLNDQENSSFSCECGYYKKYEQCVTEKAMEVLNHVNFLEYISF